MLRQFWERHPEAEQVLRNWHSVAEHSQFEGFADVRATFQSADYVAPFTVFNIGGNNYRVVAIVRYLDRKIFVRWVMTHREYDRWCKSYRKGSV
jgi:mRNA interferase HigB